MAFLRRQLGRSAARASTVSSVGRRQPAAIAAARVSRASLLLGGFGLVSAIFVLGRLFESWRVTPHAASHRISILGQTLSYPTANAGAIVMIVLAGFGLIVTAMAIGGTVRELAAARRFHRRLAAQNPRPLRGALVIDDERPLAFCEGLIQPRVYVSTGALALLDDAGLDAVLAHEHQHAARHDPLRLALPSPRAARAQPASAGAGRAQRRRGCGERGTRQPVRPRRRDPELCRRHRARPLGRG